MDAAPHSESHLDASHGELLVRTGVTGRAAKMGHRLTIRMNSWQAAVSWSDGQPTAVHLTVDVDSLEVLGGEGGLTPLSAPERALARSNALACLNSGRYPRINFQANDIAKVSDGYRLTGALQIHGRQHQHGLDVRVEVLGDSTRLRCDTEVRHSDYDIKRYSMLMGAMKVADTVTVSLSATAPTDAGR